MFIDQMFETLQTKSFLSSPSTAPVQTGPVSAPTAPKALQTQAAPAVVSSYRPEPPANAPTGPAAAQPIAGPSNPRSAPSGENGQAARGDVEMGENGQPGKRQKCRDYHGALLDSIAHADEQNKGSA